MRRFPRQRVLIIIVLVAAALLTACGPPPPPAKEELLRVDPQAAEQFGDDLDQASLRAAVEQSLRYLKRISPDRRFIYGPDATTARGLINSYQELLRLLDVYGLSPDFWSALKAEFNFYAPPGQVLFTGYYEPLLEGRHLAEGRFTSPLYGQPEDLISLNLKDWNLEPKVLRGRVNRNRLVPYHTRAQIDKGALQDRGLELAWVDPVESFFLHIQGSGKIRFQDGQEIRVNYADQNGHPYVSLGKIMIERGLMKREEVSLQGLKDYLREHPREAGQLLETNPSYVFFRIVKEGPLGCLEVPLTPGRSLALDRKRFPDAGLCLVQTRLPVIESGQIVDWRPVNRLVLAQDTGGAIAGFGRADLFFGAGQAAELGAGNLKESGRLLLLLHRDAVE